MGKGGPEKVRKVYAAQEGKSITDIVEKSVRNYINNKVNK